LRNWAMVVAVLVMAAPGAGAQSKDKDAKADKVVKAEKAEAFVGTWSGSWTGGSDGTLELTIAKGADGKLGGSITASPASSDTFTASFKTAAVEGGKLTATFDSPDGGAEATLIGELEAGVAKGAYTLKEKAQGSVVETGTWSAKKK
jgi:hypothetical protein